MSILTECIMGNNVGFIVAVITADSGVNTTIPLDDLNNQQNGTYQSLPEPISSAQMIYSPPAQADPLLQQGVYHPPPSAQENYTHATTQLHQGAYEQTTGQLHPAAFQQPAAEPHQGPYQCQTVSKDSSKLYSNL